MSRPGSFFPPTSFLPSLPTGLAGQAGSLPRSLKFLLNLYSPNTEPLFQLRYTLTPRPFFVPPPFRQPRSRNPFCPRPALSPDF